MGNLNSSIDAAKESIGIASGNAAWIAAALVGTTLLAMGSNAKTDPLINGDCKGAYRSVDGQYPIDRDLKSRLIEEGYRFTVTSEGRTYQCNSGHYTSYDLHTPY